MVIISIHAPARGATFYNDNIMCFDVISIHAPARGATQWGVWVTAYARNFNPRSRKGSDFKDMTVLYNILYISIHAPARGATKVDDIDQKLDELFQSTLPQGERL